MEFSACQRETVSCGACCGVFNLELDRAGRRRLLLERFGAFASVKFQEASTFVEYRREREEHEARYNRLNHETYVCPFYGYLPDGDARGEEPPPDTRTGCMIHPSRTGLEHSQNFSFYGASICADYDCSCKEKDEEQLFSRFLERHFPGEDYGRLMGDVLLYSALEKVPEFPGFLWGGAGGGEDRPRVAALLDILRARLTTSDSRGMTSFAIKFRWFETPEREFQYLLEDADADAGELGRSIRILLKKTS